MVEEVDTPLGEANVEQANLEDSEGVQEEESYGEEKAR